MPVSRPQLDRLAKELIGHERRATELRESIRLQQDELKVHETVLRLGRDDRLLAALNELHDQQDLFQDISTDLRGHFASKGVEVPEGAEIEVSGTRLLAHMQQGPYRYKAIWDRTSGFSVEVVSAPSRPTETTIGTPESR
jgi:hypothetical protein